MKVSTGYEGPDYLEEDKKVKPPEECKWAVLEKKVADSDDEVLYATIECDEETLGSVRLPNPEYLRFLRERIQG